VWKFRTTRYTSDCCKSFFLFLEVVDKYFVIWWQCAITPTYSGSKAMTRFRGQRRVEFKEENVSITHYQIKDLRVAGKWSSGAYTAKNPLKTCYSAWLARHKTKIDGTCARDPRGGYSISAWPTLLRPEMSIGLDPDNNEFCSIWIRTVNRFKNLGTGLRLR